MNFDFHLLNNLPGAIGFKDLNSVYLAGNTRLVKDMGYKRPQEIVGCTDFEIKSDMVSLASTFRAHDKQVLQSGEHQVIDTGVYPDGVFRAHLSTKKPLINSSGAIIGTVFYRVELHSNFLRKLHSRINLSSAPGCYHLGGKFDAENLSSREAETLFYLIRGYSAKEISLRLNLSSKTIEYYIEQLKVKFSSRKRSELIEQAIESGFIFNFPRSLL
ncbi:TPA: helix-turn-helix transcriptional regulator [Legionella pneumophila]